METLFDTMLYMRTETPAERSACHEFLLENEYAVVATATVTGTPNAAVVTYLIDDDWHVYFLPEKKRRKLKTFKQIVRYL